MSVDGLDVDGTCKEDTARDEWELYNMYKIQKKDKPKKALKVAISQQHNVFETREIRRPLELGCVMGVGNTAVFWSWL